MINFICKHIVLSIALIIPIMSMDLHIANAQSSYSFESYNYPGRFIRHRNYLGEITGIRSDLDRKDASFRRVAGLAGQCSSFESVNYPGYYLRHQNYRIKLNRNDGSDLFRKDATFCLKRGLADSRYTSFESYNYPGFYIRHKNFLLYIEKGQGDLFNKDTTFKFQSGF